MNREEYVKKLKTQLDQWNAEATKWEAKAQGTQASVKQEYEKQLKALHGRRDEAMVQLKLVQNASTEAWRDMMRGADQAWKSMHDAFNQAKSHFDKK